jgi:hypothetical protein
MGCRHVPNIEEVADPGEETEAQLMEGDELGKKLEYLLNRFENCNNNNI